ncbi:15491_t:CDS:2, partial [Dentiscutata heterogama]
MGRIRKNEIPSVTLSEVDYENYCKKFPSDLKRSLSFSNQVKLHDTLRAIKESNKFTEEFFTAARCYTNELELKIAKKAESNQSLIEELTNSILSSEECISNSNSIANNISKDKNPKEYLSNQTADHQQQSQSISSSNSLILCDNEPPIIVLANIWNTNNLEAENTDLKIKNAALESENTNLKIENAALELALVNHKLSHKELESQIQESKNRIQVLETEKVNLKLSHKELEAQIQEAKNKIQDLEIQIQESKNKVQDLEAKRSELQKIHTDLTLKYSFTQKDLVKLQHEKVENEEEIKTLKVEINKIIAARNQIENDLKDEK